MDVSTHISGEFLIARALVVLSGKSEGEMKAAILNETGGPEKLLVQEVADPVAKANEVVVRLQFAALNHVDTWLRTGSPAYPLKAGQIPGCDGAGIVESVGPGAEGVSPDDHVLIFPAISCGKCVYCRAGADNLCETFEIFGTKRNGTCAQLVSVPDTNLVPVPEGFPLDEAAAFPLSYLTAWHMLFTRANLKANETVFVSGAGSGIGAAAIQLAKWKGARVLASTSDAGKVAKIKRLGATDVFVHAEGQDVGAQVLEKTAGKGVDVVVEHVGQATWDASFKALAKQGRLVTCGATTGVTAPLDLRGLFSREATVLGGRMGTEKDFQELCRVMLAGTLHPAIDRTFSLDAIVEAHRYFDDRKHVGKVLIDVR